MPAPRLLVVEDEPSLCVLLSELLRSEYEVVEIRRDLVARQSAGA